MNNVKNVMVVESFNKTAFKEITSSSVPAGMMLVEGVLGVVDVVNRNNRIYSKAEYVTHVNDLNQRIQESNGVLGELEHPKSMTINLNNISHKVMEVKVNEDGNVVGKVLLLDTPKGKIAQSVVRSGSPLPISSRAQGQVMEDGSVKLRHLATYDLVGTAGFAQASLTESVEENGQVVFESYVFDLDNNGLVVEESANVNENSNVDYAVIESMIRRIILEEKGNIVAEGSQEDFGQSIDEAMIGKYLPLIESWVTQEFAPTMANSVQQWVTEEFAPVVESWVTEEFAPVVESWVTQDAVPTLLNEALSKGEASINNAIVEEQQAPVNEDNEELKVEAPVNAEFTSVDKNAEIFKSELLTKLDAVVIKAEESHDEPAANTDKTTFVDESLFAQAPIWLKKCPQEFKHLWAQLNESQKDVVYRRASVRIMETFEDVNAFWNGLNFSALVENANTPYRRNQPSVMVTESVNAVNPRSSVAAMAKMLKQN